MRVRTEIIALLFACIAVLSCSQLDLNPKTAAGGDRLYAVTAESTAFYRYGPLQGNGPDKKLDKGTLMNLIRPSFGFCKVKLKSGEQGYIANEDIAVASSALIAAANVPPQSRRAARFDLDSSDPRLIMPPEPLPEISFEPTPIPEPPPDN
jgi:hypothetical protein